MDGVPVAPPAAATLPGRRLVFAKPRQFYWKTALLLATTLSLIPILLSKNEMAATLYVLFLLVVHVTGLAIFAAGVHWREDIARSRRGLWIRLAGIGAAMALLYLASKGLRSETGSALFWGSLFAIWVLHTGALALLHIRGREASTACPFA